MLIKDLIYEVQSAVTVNKARSGLTILGIVIGIGSVIAMISIGQGAQNSIQTSIQSIGANLILIMPGAQRTGQVSGGQGSAQSLTLKDATSLSSISTIQAVSPEVSRRYQVTAKGNNTNTQVTASTPAYTRVRNIEIDSGTFYTEAQNNSKAKVAVIGPTVRDDLFGTDANPIGSTIRINKLDFKVIGMTKSKGGSGFGNQDDVIYVPLNTAMLYLSNSKYLSTIAVEAKSADVISDTQQEITSLLLTNHKISDSTLADFSTLNQADIVATASSVTGTFTILLAAIASISLLVGGIGIMNMMLTTVTERTREIGLRKAIGAKSYDISVQFLMEAVLLTFLGGAIGIVLGWLIAQVVSMTLGVATSVSIDSVIMAFGVSAAIGIIFGFYPARRASRLNPIEALRHD
jgi:putative ABC transport system permease protein